MAGACLNERAHGCAARSSTRHSAILISLINLVFYIIIMQIENKGE